MHNLEHIRKMAHSPVYNYAIPGLSSWLLGKPTPDGCVRLFLCERTHHEPIIPHSHRFDFQCLVLRGEVCNVTWEEAEEGCNTADDFVVSTLTYGGEPGTYTQTLDPVPKRYKHKMHAYGEGEWYGMKHNEIHSIYFARGTAVLFFEGPNWTNETLILEPYVNGERVPTFKVEPWMFKKD